MRERIATMMEFVTSARELEAAWLNTLSLMEYTALRKITRTVAEKHPTEEVLNHLMIESHRAARFKALSSEVAGRPADAYLCEVEAKRYFARLDDELSAWAEMIAQEDSATELNYLLVTSMVEHRALTLYRAYREATPTESVRRWLDEILVEGEARRVRIAGMSSRALRGFGITTLAVPEAVESAYFIELLGALEAELGVTEMKLSA